jgi:hypothetical protein
MSMQLKNLHEKDLHKWGKFMYVKFAYKRLDYISTLYFKIQNMRFLYNTDIRT